MDLVPRVKFNRVKKTQSVKTAAGWKIERKETKNKNRVSLTVYTPGGRLRLRVTMTLEEWKELKK